MRALVAFGLTLFLAGCGGGGTKSLAEALADARTSDDVANILRKYESAADDAMKSAFCQGVTTYNQEGSLPDASGWWDFLVGEAQEVAIGVSTDTLQDKADELTTTLDLAQINPRVAQLYARGCLLRG